MIKIIIYVLFFIPSISLASSEELCNKLGGGKDDNFYAYQFCDFLTGNPVTPIVASTRTVAKGSTGLKNKDGHWHGFNLNLYKNKIVITKEFSTRMYGKAIIQSVQGSIDNGNPFDFKVINYGFGERLGNTPGVVREAVLYDDYYTSISEAIRKGESIKVVWVEKDLSMGKSAKYIMKFSLKDSAIFINHLNKDTFAQ
ncbi:hypothetical protein [Vibrio metschnikovii]|uniref:hypothetical protein n=1 Tax=Vibrio metschnikovii TaxID=28172 RepID=UPI001C2FFA24|nr:hypothetical protein [Vibrio metschnikovii]